VEGSPFQFSQERPAPSRCRRCGRDLEPIAVPVPGRPGQVRWIARVRCDCEIVEWEQRQTELQQTVTGASHQVSAGGLGDRFAASSLANFERRPGTEAALAEAEAFVRSFRERHGAGEGLLFTGPFGSGKTRLAAAVLNEVQERYQESVRGEVVPDLLQRLRTTYDPKAVDSEDKILQPLLRAALLLLDDIGAERVSEWVQERLFLVIDHRYRRRLPTLFTTNLHPQDLEERLGGRIVSRIVGMARLVRLSSEDYRFREHPGQSA